MHFSCGGRREHMAGKRLREVMEKHHMRATSAEQGGSTWFGDGERPRSSMMWALAPCSMLWPTPTSGI